MTVLVFILTFITMEFVAWFTHRFVMHGFLWRLHEDHHVPNRQTFFEKNDAFFLIFATPGALCIILGSVYAFPLILAVGVGITVYGACYFLVHDVLIHKRFNWFKRTKNPYLKALKSAHQTHHKKPGKEDGECFGMLIVPLKFYREAWLKKTKLRKA